MKRVLLMVIVCLAITRVLAQDDISIGKYKKIQSTVLGGEVTCLVHLPDGYDKSTMRYPVIYMMNGQSASSFANAFSTLENLSSERIPDMILIGISNTGVAANYRSCPDSSGNVPLGDAFTRFIKEELIPEINHDFRTNDYKLLFGQSNSGLYVLYSFFMSPGLFDAYIVASPMFGWCPEFFAEKARSFLSASPALKKKLYISYGELDYVEVLNYINGFSEILKQSPSGLSYKVDLVENAGHVPFISLNNALLYFFSECTIKAESKKLSISEIKSHFEILSADFGFKLIPKSGVLFDMAIDCKNGKEFDRAIELLKYLISLYPGSDIYSYVLGLTYLQKGDLAHAEESFTEALIINPDFIQAKNELDKLRRKN